MDLVLHIGTEKTGTSTLQDWLYANKETLSAEGVYLSSNLGIPNNRKLVSYFQQQPDEFWQMNRLSSAEDKERFFSGFLEDLAEEVRLASETHTTMVISSEHFHSRLKTDSEISFLRDYLSSLFSNITVVCYFRPQSDVRRSLYSTSMRSAGTEMLNTFHAKADESWHYYNYYEVASCWARQFGKENLALRVFDPANFVDGDLRLDFLQTLPNDVPADKLDLTAPNSNESLSYLKARAFRVINAREPRFPPEGGVSHWNLALKDIVEQATLTPDTKLVDLVGTEFFLRFADSNKKLSREFFEGRELFEPPRAASHNDDEHKYSMSDIGAVVEALVGAFASDLKPRLLLDSDAPFLRDVAVKVKTGAPLTADDAIGLMELAVRARPDGLGIRQTLETWRASSDEDRAAGKAGSRSIVRRLQRLTRRLISI